MKKSKVRLHIRRCHICAGVTECEGAVVNRCQSCGKTMAPFYFFNEFEVTPYTDGGVRRALILGPNERIPVWGFTAYW
jgi:hypothetical protein